MVSNIFYEGWLTHNRSAFKKHHIFFHNIGGFHTNFRGSASLYSKDDTSRCLRIHKQYQKTCEQRSQSIQILTFYTAQGNDVRKKNSDIMVSSVDAFQGREADVVILSLSARKIKLNNFMIDPRRICVALSRARNDLHIVGHRITMKQSPLWREILKYCYKINN